MSTTPFQIGDRVTFMEVKGSLRGGMRMSTREGSIARIDGSLAYLKRRGKKHLQPMALGNLRRADQKTEVNEIPDSLAGEVAKA